MEFYEKVSSEVKIGKTIDKVIHKLSVDYWC